MAIRALTPELTFEEAAERFMEIRRMAPSSVGVQQAGYVRKNTEKAWRRYTESLKLFFGGIPLREIRWYNMRAYQQARLAGDPPFIRRRRPHEEPTGTPVKPQQVNQELSFLGRLKRLAGCWTPEDDSYFVRLQTEEDDTQRALEPDEQTMWLDVSRSQQRWEIVHWYSLAAFDTLMSTNELRGLRLGDVQLGQRLVSVPWAAAKNKYRRRLIALENADVLWAFEKLLWRAGELGAREPLHYLFPFIVTRSKLSHPERPMTESGLKKRWEEVRQATGLTWFRPYDTRHTGATRYAEAGIPVDVIVARMGHASQRMREHYTHISTQAQRRWLRGVPSGGYAPQAITIPYAAIRPVLRKGT